ncbi:uncharacterized protein LOC126758450 [Bactrocera neohumeralis]|uniref:uncharacterized protein LOC126758450 n=1 Tax=Bactrocera neohumeralis TaxID=98809 RepID=UPI002165CE86|nr:uncharacterized protein LOC126758450 [Bactrocera neohumeralis]
MHYGICWLCAGLLLLAGVQLTEAALGHVFYHNDAHPGKCTVSETVILSPGEVTITSGICARITCENEEGLAEIASCGSQAPLEGCEWGDPKDEKAPYPECCERQQICPQKTKE